MLFLRVMKSRNCAVTIGRQKFMVEQRKCRARSKCTYVQADLALDSLQNRYMVANARIMDKQRKLATDRYQSRLFSNLIQILISKHYYSVNQSVENDGVAFVKGANVRNQ